jgi:hypothetical protein
VPGVVAVALATGGGSAPVASAQASPDPPVVTAYFAQGAAVPGQAVGLSISLSNSDSTAGRTGVAVAATLPAGLTVTTPSELDSSCDGTVAAADGGTTITVSGVTLQAFDPDAETSANTCSIVLDVVGAAPGQFDFATGPVTSAESGPGGSSNTTSLALAPPPTIAEAFSPPTVVVGDTSTVTYTLSNPATSIAYTGIGFADVLPEGVRVADEAADGSCVTQGDAILAAEPDAGTISLLSLTLPPGTACTLSLTVDTRLPTSVDNPTGPLQFSYDSGTGDLGTASTAGATAPFVAVGPPTLGVTSGVTSIALGGVTSLSYTLSNPNATTGLSGVGFTATLPAGLRVATPDGTAGSCGGTVSAAAGSGTITVASVPLAAAAQCTVKVDLVGTAAGTQTVTTSAVTSVEGGSGAGPEPLELTVVAPAPTPPAPPPGGPPLPGAAKPPTTTFLVGTVSGSKSGTVSFDVGVPGSGSVEVLETMGRSAAPAVRVFNPGDGRVTFARKTAKATKAGRLHIVIKPGARGRKAVRSKRNRRGLRLNVWVRFTPTGYSPVTGGRLHTVYRKVRVGG